MYARPFIIISFIFQSFVLSRTINIIGYPQWPVDVRERYDAYMHHLTGNAVGTAVADADPLFGTKVLPEPMLRVQLGCWEHNWIFLWEYKQCSGKIHAK